jgi:transposase
MVMHYGVGVLPTRPRKPRDKAKVDVGVQIAEVGSSPRYAIAGSSRWAK